MVAVVSNWWRNWHSGVFHLVSTVCAQLVYGTCCLAKSLQLRVSVCDILTTFVHARKRRPKSARVFCGWVVRPAATLRPMVRVDAQSRGPCPRKTHEATVMAVNREAAAPALSCRASKGSRLRFQGTQPATDSARCKRSRPKCLFEIVDVGFRVYCESEQQYW